MFRICTLRDLSRWLVCFRAARVCRAAPRPGGATCTKTTHFGRAGDFLDVSQLFFRKKKLIPYVLKVPSLIRSLAGKQCRLELRKVSAKLENGPKSESESEGQTASEQDFGKISCSKHSR